METIAVKRSKKTVDIFYLSIKNVWTSYDDEGDILYLHFKKPNHADHSEMTGDEIIIRYAKGEIIGFTILNASTRMNT